MSGFSSGDGHWVWNGRRWKHTSELTSDQVHILNENNREIWEGLHEDEPLEAIELDEIELSQPAEDTPLLESAFSDTLALAEAGGESAASAAAAPGVGTILTGLGTTTLAIGGGTLGTVLLSGSGGNSDSHEDPVVSLPGHRYIGPGNTVDDTVPVDHDDSIAREHDIAYERAQTQEDIQEADRHGASEFLTDAIHNYNPHSVAGYIGLKAKEKVESVIGVKYPANLPSVSGMSSRVPRALRKYPIDKDPRDHPDFPKRSEYSPGAFVNRVRYIWDAWNRARQNHGLPRVDPPARLGISATPKPPIDRRTGNRPSSNSISYREWRNRTRGLTGPLIDGFNRQREQSNARNDHLLNTVVANEIGADEAREIEEIIRQVDNGGSISIADFDNADGAGPSNAQVEAPPMDTRGTKRVHDGAQGGSSAPPNPASAVRTATASGTGHNSGSDGGFDSAQGPISTLMKGGYSTQHGTFKFEKVHRIKSWAIPYWNIKGDYFDGSNTVTTPLIKIPWEYTYFYLSPEEFDLLPAGSYIDSVSIEIMQTVATTGYPTGGSTASVATTNHPKVLMIGDDLESKVRGGVNREIKLTADMIPSFSTATTKFSDDFILRQYGTDQTAADNAIVVPGAAHKIPYYSNYHFHIYQPDRAQAKARKFFTESGDPVVISDNVAPGFEYFQNYIKEINSNDTTWDFVDSKFYKFENAPIGEQYRMMEILTDNLVQSTGAQNQYFNAKRSVSNNTPDGNVTISESIVPSTRNSLPIVTYKSAPIEQGSYFVRGDKAGKPSRQPSYHIGMRAIDKLDPTVSSSRATTFVQANIEFEIKATMMVRGPSYPNRFLRPKTYTTSIENAVMGIGTYPAFNDERFVTFGLYNESATAPTRAAVDQINDEPTEDGSVIPGRNMRPRRAIPKVGNAVKPKKRK